MASPPSNTIHVGSGGLNEAAIKIDDGARIEIDQDIINTRESLMPLQAKSHIDQAAFRLFGMMCIDRSPDPGAAPDERGNFYLALAQESYRAAQAFWLVKDTKNILEKGIRK
jgi:hypothetical protein